VKLSWRRVLAIARKELRDLRRNRSVVIGMAIVPVVFCIQPLIAVFSLSAAASSRFHDEHVLIFMLGIPALVPAFVAAYSIVGERLQGTLEPILSTPIRRDELLLGKALAALVPSIAISYAVAALVLLLILLFAQPGVASAVVGVGDVAAQIVFTPLLAGWSIWTAILISARSSDPRTAQQLASLTGLPAVVVAVLVAINVIPASFEIALGGVALLLVLNVLGWLVASAAFDRERLITSTK
jgi:ABC-type Na+ efflux pump permease subunit